MVCLDDDGEVVRPALLWNDTRSAGAAADLIAELGGRRAAWADAVGLVPVASFTVTKLRWLAEHEPDNAAPHGGGLPAARLADLAARRRRRASTRWSPTAATRAAPATGRPRTGEYRPDLLRARRSGAAPPLPRVLGPAEAAGAHAGGALLGAGTGDNAAAALGLGAGPGDVVVSIGTSGVVSRRRRRAVGRPDRHRRRLRRRDRPLPAAGRPRSTPPGSSTRRPRLLGVDHAGLSELALSAPPGRRRARPRARTWRASARRTGPTPPAPCTGCSCATTDAGAPGPRRGRGAALRAGRRPRRARGAGRRGPSGCC